MTVVVGFCVVGGGREFFVLFLRSVDCYGLMSDVKLPAFRIQSVNK